MPKFLEMSASAETRKLVRELQNDMRHAQDKSQLIRSLTEAVAFAKSVQDQTAHKSTNLKLPSINPAAKVIFMRDFYSNFASFMLDFLSTDLSSSLTKQEFLQYFARYFLDGCCEDAFLAICGAIQQSRY